ncbi:hypothetical protein CRYUN_Cryun24cG0097900 [Craigia yunnanensis]
MKETNMFTVDKYQQLGFFPKERAFSLRYQTAGMLETVLRLGVLGEDDTGEESPKNLKLPSHRPCMWEGHSVTKCSGDYGSTMAEADTVALLEMDDKNKLIQDVTSTGGGRDIRTNVHWSQITRLNSEGLMN